ncbi:DUF6350 family protein [Streptomyces sp. ODS28]|uniref:cell division protein PerM n=1 Tax=Streptomyces sp. ODS28 TaxID=3136688 RepID=UPI0031E6643D
MATASGWLVGGAAAAVLGLGACAVLVMVLWVTSPYPDSGPGDALRVAADVWLLAHGTQLVRENTLSGHPAPVEMVPLLLTALPAWLLYRGMRSVLTAVRMQPGVPRPLRVAGWYAGGYLLTGVAAMIFAAAGQVRVDMLSAVFQLPLFTLAAVGLATWTGCDRPVLRLPARLRTERTAGLRRVLNWPRLVGASYAAGAGLAALFGGGGLLAAAALVWDAPGARYDFPQLSGSWTGHVALLLLAVSLLPNAALWGAAYAMGPGFSVGAGGVAGPMTALAPGGAAHLPPFPLFAALPGPGAPTGWAPWAVLGALPLTAGVLCGWYAGRHAAPVRGSRSGSTGWRGTVLNAGLAGLFCGLATGILAGYAGGALGSAELAEFGPHALLTGAAAAVWTAVPGAPVALVVRAVRLRGTKPERGPEERAEGEPKKEQKGKGAGKRLRKPKVRKLGRAERKAARAGKAARGKAPDEGGSSAQPAEADGRPVSTEPVGAYDGFGEEDDGDFTGYAASAENSVPAVRPAPREDEEEEERGPAEDDPLGKP